MKKFMNMMEKATGLDLDGNGAVGDPVPAGVPAHLPPNWSTRVDPHSGRTFYMNHDTKKTQWHPPPASSYQPPVNPNYHPASQAPLTGALVQEATPLPTAAAP
eukprot:CAMPEP_0173441452 /NCGR_PEP_ID=MMETSP1357-20121228/23969_1 /TAXON_ID=77926 /ORGANISM="Hemiselmis rufescens, Strain PCC563" /LENGTH=102 /DNA_ID=CAMNT_0014407035 /DNA_START=80 /DNA_END=384 /DNA_ORIENTATION=-